MTKILTDSGEWDLSKLTDSRESSNSSGPSYSIWLTTVWYLSVGFSISRPIRQRQTTARAVYRHVGKLLLAKQWEANIKMTNISGRWNKNQLMAISRLWDGTEPAIFVPKLLGNVTYPHCVMMAWQFTEYSWGLALFLVWIITIGNSSIALSCVADELNWVRLRRKATIASAKICQKRYLFSFFVRK